MRAVTEEETVTDSIQKVYLEITSECNLSCPMCSRNHWKDEATGHMTDKLFTKAVREINEMDEVHTIFFGGVGEPLVHPRVADFIERAKSTGKRVELVTNGTLLKEPLIGRLIDSGLDQLWISIDSTDVQQYAEIRSGADHNALNNSLQKLKELIAETGSELKTGMSFVLMKKNLHLLPELPDYAGKLGISDIKISNVIANSPEMAEQALYLDTMTNLPWEKRVNIDLPMFDINEKTMLPLSGLISGDVALKSMGSLLEQKRDHCRFIHEGNVFIRWDGHVSPCMALLHTSTTYLNDYNRTLKHASFGNFNSETLSMIWAGDAYQSFRERVRLFDFSPCTLCNGCNNFENNEEDCYDNEFPTCGGCVWAQGFVQCP